MVDHGDIFNNLIFIGWFYPLQEGENRKWYIIDGKAACLVDIH